MNLELGEVQCDRCFGKGYSNKGKIHPTCPKCSGLGKLDWIDNIKGSNETFKNLVSDITKTYIAEESKKLSKDINKVSHTIDKLNIKVEELKNILRTARVR